MNFDFLLFIKKKKFLIKYIVQNCFLKIHIHGAIGPQIFFLTYS